MGSRGPVGIIVPWQGGGMPVRPDDHDWLARAVELARHCPPSTTAYAVGAVLVDGDGREWARGHSRQHHPHDHAEEVALAAVGDGASPQRFAGATLYSSLEPCTSRRSRPVSCTARILAVGVGRVVLAWREPDLLADCHGVADLRAGGVEVVELPELAAAAREINAHLLS